MIAMAGDVPAVLLGLGVILLGAKLGGEIFQRLKQPPVLGELLVGVLFGNLHLAGLHVLEFLRHQHALAVLAEIGIVLLLFEIGAGTTLRQMMRVGSSALAAAVLGVVAPSILGFFAARHFFPDESVYAHLFVGAILCATSVGITARVLRDLGKTHTREARIVLGAAVIDDVLGLIVLAVVSGLILAANAGQKMGAGAIAWIAGKAVLFLVVATVVGRWASVRAFKWLGGVHGSGFLLAVSLAFCFLLAYASHLAGLAPIVGAFTAGLILKNEHFERLAGREKRTIEDLLQPLTALLLPVFFVLMGLQVRLDAFGQAGVLAFAAVLSAAAVIGKLVCGLGVFRCGADRLTVGLGMVPRGEVGLIFAGVGMTLALAGRPVVTPAIFSGVVIMVLVTTLVTPVLLGWRLRRVPDRELEELSAEHRMRLTEAPAGGMKKA